MLRNIDIKAEPGDAGQLARHTKSTILEEYAFECGVTHWMHVDWMFAMTLRAA